MAPGRTLNAQLIYPRNDVCLSNDRIMELLGDVGLDVAVQTWCGEDLAAERNWDQVFSAGELQRIALARVIFHK